MPGTAALTNPDNGRFLQRPSDQRTASSINRFHSQSPTSRSRQLRSRVNVRSAVPPTPPSPGAREALLAQHRAIYKAVKAGDPSAARHLLCCLSALGLRGCGGADPWNRSAV
ncbi:FCD domain-containing protein [Mesorhizobium caraganae]|nr:FCD domain-containing protein [Mesorhizobium caraganae]